MNTCFTQTFQKIRRHDHKYIQQKTLHDERC